MAVKKATPSIYRLKITLLDIKPGIWRRIEVPNSILLCCLHSAIQVAMGWTDSHLHQFQKDGKNWGVPEFDEFNEFNLIDEDTTMLGKVFTEEGDSMAYQYDFGDDWSHQILLEQIMPANEALKAPVCLGGERRCPPENVGGIPGYEEFLQAIFDPAHENYEQFVRWAGGHFQDEFDVKAVNKKLSRMRWPVKHRR
jgi:hypothetical protein